MEIETTIVDPRCDCEWDREVGAHPDASFFHSAAWARVLCKTYGHPPVYLRCSQHGEPVALVPVMEVRSVVTGRRGVCLPFSDFCGPLRFDGSDSLDVIGRLCEIGRKHGWKHVEIRGKIGEGMVLTPTEVFYAHTLDLRRGVAALRKICTSSTRCALHKAERSGLTAEISRSRAAVLDFYRLHTQTRRRHGLPPQPVSFFQNIYAEVIEPGHGFVVLVRKAARAAAAAVFFQFGKKALYKFGASDHALQALRANNLMMWEGIRSLAEQGFESLHFGRTALANTGLRRFKLGWGTTEEAIGYYRFDPLTGKSFPARPGRGGAHPAVFGWLPLALNRLAGTLIYPHLD